MVTIDKELQNMTALKLLDAWWVQLKKMFILDEKGELIAVDNYEKLRHKLEAIDQELELKLPENTRMPYKKRPELEG